MPFREPLQAASQMPDLTFLLNRGPLVHSEAEFFFGDGGRKERIHLIHCLCRIDASSISRKIPRNPKE